MAAAAFARLDDLVGRAEDLFLAASHGLIAGLVLLAVFYRYVLGDPLVWTEEFVVTLFGWMLFIGLASAFRTRMHIRIDVLLLVLPRRAWGILGAAAVLVTLATLLALAWFGVEQAMMLASNETPMLRISAAWGVAALPVGAALSCLHILRHAVEHGVGETLWPADPVAAVEESHVA